MPIIVKDYTWTQTLQTLNIKIPVSSVAHEKIDIFTTDTYIKANYNPFLLEIFLLHEVDNNKSKGIVTEDLIIFDLVKKQELEWECLEKELSKGDKMKIKQEVLEKSQEKAKQQSEDRWAKKTQLDRYAVQQAMDIDTKQHALMDSRRDEERKKAMDALEEWRAENTEDITPKEEVPIHRSYTRHSSGVKIVELPSEGDQTHKKDSAKMKLTNGIVSKPFDKVSTPIKTVVKSEYVERKKKEAAARVLPKLRDTIQLEITHTPRTFPTPSRESTAREEEAWIKNITLARRATGFVSEDLRPEEQDPQWCKEKGDEFFRAGNFLGAVSAYTHAIQLSDTLPSLFANRAATHFALGNFNKCVNDCSSALELMVPRCEGNRRSRAKCIARRAAALARLGYLSKAIGEMKAASKLLPGDENIKKDIEDMEKAWEQNPDSD